MISRELLEKVRLIEIRARHMVEDVFSGQYESVFKGRGIEFEEVREYVPGDDIRTIDWNVTARMGELYIKKHREERELTVMLLVDVSGSQDFGSADKLKSEVTAELCAVLAFSAMRNSDRVGLMTFADRVLRFIPPKKGKRHGMRVIREILHPDVGRHAARETLDEVPTAEQRGKARLSLSERFKNLLHPGSDWSFQPKTNVGEALRFLNSVVRKRCITFVVSDFVSSDRFMWDLSLTSKHHDLTACVIYDPREEELPKIGMALVEDPETKQIALIDTNDRRYRQAFAKRRKKERQELVQALRASNVDFALIPTSGDYFAPLVGLFERRKKRISLGR